MFSVARRLALGARRQVLSPGYTNKSFASRAYSLSIPQPPVQCLATAPRWQGLNDLIHDGLVMISTLKRRRKMMNKHKLRKRRKKNRMKTKK
mmetsp:Transcript_25310/g.62317  ORF Transcript_25310/g.62317 Transcript_25310/m.62317 type:complete len:92 (-) Transcript_25310:240-515(-)